MKIGSCLLRTGLLAGLGFLVSMMMSSAYGQESGDGVITRGASSPQTKILSVQIYDGWVMVFPEATSFNPDHCPLTDRYVLHLPTEFGNPAPDPEPPLWYGPQLLQAALQALERGTPVSLHIEGCSQKWRAPFLTGIRLF